MSFDNNGEQTVLVIACPSRKDCAGALQFAHLLPVPTPPPPPPPPPPRCASFNRQEEPNRTLGVTELHKSAGTKALTAANLEAHDQYEQEHVDNDVSHTHLLDLVHCSRTLVSSLQSLLTLDTEGDGVRSKIVGMAL